MTSATIARFAVMPVTIFAGYLCLFGVFSALLGNSADFRPPSDIPLSHELPDLVSVRLALAKWGVSLVVFATIGVILVAYAGRFATVSLLPSRYATYRKAWVGIFWGALITLAMFGILYRVPVSGGLQGYLYKLAQSSVDPTVTNVDGVMTLITTLTLVPALAVSLALTALCIGTGEALLAQVKRYRNLMTLTAAFLCVGIVQVFLQYNWLTGFLADADMARSIRSSMTVASGSVYTGLFLSQFLCAAWLMHTSALNSEHSTVGKESGETLIKTMLGDGYIDKLRTAVLLLSPLITGLFADLPELFR